MSMDYTESYLGTDERSYENYDALAVLNKKADEEEENEYYSSFNNPSADFTNFKHYSCAHIEDVITQAIREDERRGINYDDITIEQIMEDYHSGSAWRKERAETMVVKKYNSLVHMVVNTYFYSYKTQYIEDLLQQGRLGLHYALEKYTTEKGQPLTYFIPYIRKMISDYITFTVSCSTRHYENKEKDIKAAIEAFKAEGITSYTAYDIEIRTGIPATTIQAVLDQVNHRILYVTPEEDELDPLSFISDGISIEEEYNSDVAKSTFFEVFDTLSELERKVLILRTGCFTDEPPMKTKGIAEKLNVSKDTVIRTYTVALHKLRTNPKIAALANFKVNDSIVQELDDFRAGSISIIDPQSKDIISLDDIDIDF